MIYFSHIRVALISSALLLTTALASPALAETLPEISPRQIASDVEVRFNQETGAKEYIAKSFDPFEEDSSLAGTASLRSTSSATTIDGHSVRGGALLDMTFYYNSASNDPYDTRGYEEAVYLSGEPSPVIRRDSRILECNKQVQDVVYYHEDYYRAYFNANLFRPYRHYSGHHRFDRFRNRSYGYGHGFRGSRGFGGRRGFGRHRGFGRSSRNRSRDRRGFTERIIDRVREENGLPRLPREERTDGEARREDGTTTGRTPAARDANRADRRANRANRDRSNRSRENRNRVGTRRGSRGSETNDAPRIRREGRSAAPRVTPQTNRVPRTERSPRPVRGTGSRPARADRANRAREIKSRNAPRRNYGSVRGGKRGSKLKLMSFMPMASAWSRKAVRNVDVQCAREEMLTVHIPQDRLDAARFDGLTVLVLDRTGQETPVFVPPNYIEGFRRAVSGRVTPSVSSQEPQTSAPVYQAPSVIESAPCPVGTARQEDGTCLQGGTATYGGYPTR